MSLSQEAQAIVSRLAERAPLPSLTPDVPRDDALDRRLRDSDGSEFVRGAVKNAAYARAVLSGLNQLNDNLPRAHGLAMSEDVTDENARRTLDYWHAIMHRREPDYPNSKYWWRRVGEHELFPQTLALAKEQASALPESSDARRTISGMTAWDPFAFVDLCERHAKASNPENEILRRIQAGEMRLLLEFCAAKAAE